MRIQSCRSARFVLALAGAILCCAIEFGVSAGAGTPSPQLAGGQSVFTPRSGVSVSPSKPALTKSGKLSSRLQRLSQPSVMNASANAQATAVGLPSSGPGSLLRAAGSKQVLVYVRVSGSVADASAAIENAGATIVNVSKRYGVVTAAVDPSRLQALAKLSVVKATWEALAPARSAACPTGNVVSEGDSQLNAASARSAYGVDGSGITVGILSDSYDAEVGAAAGVAAGELPGTSNPCGKTTPLNVLEDYPGATDEGRAMLEIVHDLAPGAPLSFATAQYGIFGMADNIRALRDAGAKVIADDVTYYAEPMFQEGPIDLAVDDVTSTGVPYFSSAGNANRIVGGHNVGSYEAPTYRSTTCSAQFIASAPYTYESCHDFDPGVGTDPDADYTIASGGYITVDLQWNEPWNGVSTDLDLILLNATTGALLDYSDYSNPGGTDEPFEIAGWTNSTGSPVNVRVVIARWLPSGSPPPAPRIKYVVFAGTSSMTSVQYNSSSGGDIVGPTIFGHNGGPNTISVAAVPYNNSTIPESYTSHGPVTYYFGPADGTTPASALGSPQVLAKPDLAATDCGHTSFFYGPTHVFCGTSAAAPHAAAVAALMLNHGSLPPAQLLAKLKATASPVGTATSDVVGSGLVNALPAQDYPGISFAQSSYSVSEAGSAATITIKRSGGMTSGATAQFATSNGTASAGSDYTSVTQTVSFAPGETTQTVPVPIANDTTHENDETVVLTLSAASGGGVGTPNPITLTITDDDAVPPPATTTTTTTTTPKPPVTVTLGRLVLAKLTKSSFKGSEAGKVKLTYSFAPKSTRFAFVLTFKKNGKWVKVRSASMTGNFSGKYSMTVKKLFGSKPVKRGQYRLKLSASGNSKLLAFTVR